MVPEEIQPFLAEAELVLQDMGATAPAIAIELDKAKRFLKARLARTKAPSVVKPEPVAHASTPGTRRYRKAQKLARIIVKRLGR